MLNIQRGVKMLDVIIAVFLFAVIFGAGIGIGMYFEREHRKVKEIEANYLTDDKNFYSTNRAIENLSIKDKDRE